MRPALVFFLLSFSIVTFGQLQNIDPCALFKEAMSNQNVDTLDHYLKLDDSQLAKKDRINLMTFKGAVLIRKNRHRLRNSRKSHLSLIDSSYQLFTDAINMVEDENEKIGYKMRRYETLKRFKPKYKDLSSDKIELEANGYIEEDFGFELHLSTKYDGDFWIGIEASLIGGLQLPMHFKDDNGASIKRSELGKSMSLFTFSYLKNMENSASEYKLSLLRTEAPIYVDITQIGCVSTLDKSYWYYRPEIGVGYSRFSLTYGINIFFKKESADIIPRHSLSFRTKYVF